MSLALITLKDVWKTYETGAVAVRWSAAGTHTGPYLGADPSGRTVRISAPRGP